MGLTKRIRCRHCKRLFIPDHRNRKRQKYCSASDCRKASKTASQQKWLQKPENKEYFKGPLNTQRVQAWREQNPGYWKRSPNCDQPLQDRLKTQALEIHKDNDDFISLALQDLLIVQPTVIIGLIASLIGSPLQDDIAKTLSRMQQSGQDILYQTRNEKGQRHDYQNTRFT